MKKNNTLLIIVLGALTAFGPFSIDTYLPAMPNVAQDLNASIANVQLSVTSFFLGMALGQLFVGPISDRFGRKKPMYVGIILYILASLACTLAPSAPFLIAFRFVQAVGGCAGVVIARAIVRDLFPPQETARVFSMLSLVMGVAPILAPSFGGVLLALLGWRAIFGFLTLFGTLAFIAAWTTLPESRQPDPSLSLQPLAVLRGYVAIFRQPQFLRYSVIGGLAVAGMFGYIAGAAFVYIEYFQVTPTVFAWIFGTNAFGFIFMGQVNRLWLKYRTSEEVVRWILPVQTVAGMGLLLAASLNLGGLPAIWFFNFFFSSSLGFIMPNTMALGMMPFRREAGAAAALMGAVQSVLGVLASSVVSAFHNGTPVPMTATMAACGLLSVILLQVSTRRVAPVAEVREAPYGSD